MNIEKIHEVAEQIIELEKQIKNSPKEKFKIERKIEKVMSSLTIGEVFELDEYIMTNHKMI